MVVRQVGEGVPFRLNTRRVFMQSFQTFWEMVNLAIEGQRLETL